MEQISTNPSASKLQELKERLSKVKVLEAELACCKWNEESSPKSLADSQKSLLKRYQEAKSLYMQRRLESFMVDHLSGFDEKTNKFDIPDVQSLIKLANEGSGDTGRTEDDKENNIEERHTKALAGLQTAAQSVHDTLSSMRNSFQIAISRRKELEQMLHDLEQDNEISDDIAGEMMVDDDDDPDPDAEREKTEKLQERKRQLQEDYSRLVKAKEERMQSISRHRNELALLEDEKSKIIKAGQDPSKFMEKIKELKEMKEFYDSLREVMEELGGVKILHAKEDSESRHLFLTLLVYEKHQVQVELEVYCKNLLKLRNAKWLTNPTVTSMPIVLADASGSNGDKELEQFSLPLDPLDDLVQTAKTLVGPPHDLRFIIREACAKVRFLQNRVDDIAVLRRRVLTKVVGNDQIVCSLNEGIVIVMRAYDQWVKVEQIVGVTGWEKSVTDDILKVVSKKEESWTPSKVVQLVQNEVERLQTEGLVLPKTPLLPTRRTGM